MAAVSKKPYDISWVPRTPIFGNKAVYNEIGLVTDADRYIERTCVMGPSVLY